MGEGVFVHLWVNDCDDNVSRRESYYGGDDNRTPLYNILYLIATVVAPCVLWGSTLYIIIFTVRVTGLHTMLTAISTTYLHLACVPPPYYIIIPTVRGCPYGVDTR